MAGTPLHQICIIGDSIVNEELAKVYTRGQVEKGPAFPTCVSPNNIVAYCSPGPEDSVTAATGDVLKMYAACVDLYIHASIYTCIRTYLRAYMIHLYIFDCCSDAHQCCPFLGASAPTGDLRL